MRSPPFVTCLVLLCLGGVAVDFISGRSEAALRRGFRSRNFLTVSALGRAIHPCLTSKPNGHWA